MKRIPLTVALSVVMLAACGKQERVSEVEWAKAALARNPALEIVATDERAGVFTVRDTADGSLHKLQLGELIAGPPPKGAAKPAVAPAPATPAPPAETPAAAAPASE